MSEAYIIKTTYHNGDEEKMEVQLKELLDSIKNEGVRTAEAQSKEITDKAKSEAESIIDAAKKEAEGIIAAARDDAARLESSGKAALEQAGRDLVLSLKASISKILDEIVNKELAQGMGPKVLEEGILSILKNWKADVENLEVLIDEKNASEIAASLESRLAAELKAGIVIKPFSGIDTGFRITEKDGSGYYDFSAAGLSEMIGRFLNPRLEEIVKSALDS